MRRVRARDAAVSAVSDPDMPAEITSNAMIATIDMVILGSIMRSGGGGRAFEYAA